MMMIRYILTFIVSVISLMAYADIYTISPKEQQQFLNEADDWIDDMPDGIQDRISDAVSHSLHGFFSEIEYFRNYNDTTGIGKYKVNVKEFKGGKNSNIPMVLYSGKGATKDQPLLVFFHGGGWSLGSVKTSERFCRALASEGKVKVISVDYPLAPENPYPAAVNISTEALEFIFSKAKELGCDPLKISLGGEGAGGNLALGAFFSLSKKTPSLKIKSLVLYYPLLNVSQGLPQESKRKYGRGYGFDSRVWEAFVNAYNIQGNIFQSDYLANPNEAPLNTLKTLPPVLMITAGRDIVIEEEKEFKSKISNMTYVSFDGAIHGFLSDNHQPTAFRKAVGITDVFLTK